VPLSPAKGGAECTLCRTYLTSQIDPQEKASLIVAISHFKKKEEKQ